MRTVVAFALGLVAACSRGQAIEEPGARSRAEQGAVATPKGPPNLDALCRRDGFDFAFEPRDVGDGRVEVDCGYGPGTPCVLGPAYCEGETRLLLCDRRRLNAIDCDAACRVDGTLVLNSNPYEGGMCRPRDGTATCVCCDAGEPGCPPLPPKPAPEAERARLRLNGP